jgi:hypothetical protein
LLKPAGNLAKPGRKTKAPETRRRPLGARRGMQNTVDAPTSSAARASPCCGPLPASLDVLVFADLGAGHDDAFRDEARMASIGVGANLQLGRWVAASLDYAHPMTNTQVTRVGEDHIDARVTVAY